jgi:glycogen debranching enzyme
MIDNVSGAASRSGAEEKQAKLDYVDEDKGHSAQIALKCGDSFLIMDGCGDFLPSRREMGLFRHGTRFLQTCNLFLEGRAVVPLSHQVTATGNMCRMDLTNRPLTIDQHGTIEQGIIHIERFVELEQDYLVHSFLITSFHTDTLPLKVSLKLGTDFCDLFEVRGLVRTKQGEHQSTTQNATSLQFNYRGLDEIERTTNIQYEPIADHIYANILDWALNLTRSEPIKIRVAIHMETAGTETFASAKPTVTLWRNSPPPSIITDDAFFNRLLKRGTQDIMMLSTMTPHGYFPYAGIPWFNCPFGRDGLVAALQFLPLFPQVARGTLEFLAAYQGTKVEAFTDEEPGKILHEFRTGEMANCREIPYVPYYGTVDATPLFLILLEGYIRWTNDLELLEKLWPNAVAAAQWMVKYGDQDGDTFLEYHRVSEQGLGNQGWKDSWDGITHSDGRIARSPLALSEVQGYAYAAYRAMSYLAKKRRLDEQAQDWDRTAEILQSNFLRHFWWEEEQVFYQALAENKEKCDVVSSNAGQCLWTGIVPESIARKVIARLMRDDMFSGWGMRTLSTSARRFNPMSYHNGSVWPHDTAFIGAGFALYGGKKEAAKLLKSLFDASHHFEDGRLPELYCGFPRHEGYGPTRYPVACSPQAWATGAPFTLVSALLGMNPNAEEQRLTLHQPTLPDWLDKLEIRGMHVGTRQVHLRFLRMGGHTEVVLGQDNEVDIRVI